MVSSDDVRAALELLRSQLPGTGIAGHVALASLESLLLDSPEERLLAAQTRQRATGGWSYKLSTLLESLLASRLLRNGAARQHLSVTQVR